jgi:hypothetical protein
MTVGRDEVRIPTNIQKCWSSLKAYPNVRGKAGYKPALLVPHKHTADYAIANPSYGLTA